MSTNKITTQTTKKLVRLSRLSRDPSLEFLEQYTSELENILTYINQIEEVDTGKIQPLDGLRTITIEELRLDEPAQDQEEYQKVRQNIINNFPKTQGNLLVLPAIFEE